MSDDDDDNNNTTTTNTSPHNVMVQKLVRLALSSDFFVSTENGLQGELKGLLGAGCFEVA